MLAVCVPDGNTEDQSPALRFKTSWRRDPSPVTVSHARWLWFEVWDCCGTVHKASVSAAVYYSLHAGLVSASARSYIVWNILCGRTLNYAEQQKDGGEADDEHFQPG